MELRYQPTDEDALNALRASVTPTWALFLFVLLLALLFLVGIYLLDHDLATVGWVWLAGSVALGIAVYEVPRRQARRAMRGNPSSQGEILFVLNEEGTEVTFATGKMQLQWRAYTKYKETAHLFLLYMSSARSTFIPKRVMSPHQVEELRGLLEARITSKTNSNQTR
jgi:hypothetical protein